MRNIQNDILFQLDELGRALLNLCNIVPAGIVIFFPSYNYEDIVFKHLDKSGIVSKISVKKRIYREPKLASQVSYFVILIVNINFYFVILIVNIYARYIM